MRAIPRLAAAVATLLAAACGGTAPERSDSLVGAKELPSARDLSRETIYINRGYGDASEGFLTYEFKPDNRLTVTHHDRHRQTIVRSETFRLATEAAARARRMLWRLRPEVLIGQGLTRDETRPLGCRRNGPHDFGILAVVFSDEVGDRAAEEDRIGAFELPLAESCNSPEASEARMLVDRVLKSFPQSRVAAEFPRAD